MATASGTQSEDLFESSSYRSPELAGLFYGTDDDRGGKEVERLIRSVDYEPVKIGGIDKSDRLEVGGDLHDLVVRVAGARSLIGGLIASSPLPRGRLFLPQTVLTALTVAASKGRVGIDRLSHHPAERKNLGQIRDKTEGRETTHGIAPWVAALTARESEAWRLGGRRQEPVRRSSRNGVDRRVCGSAGGQTLRPMRDHTLTGTKRFVVASPAVSNQDRVHTCYDLLLR